MTHDIKHVISIFHCSIISALGHRKSGHKNKVIPLFAESQYPAHNKRKKEKEISEFGEKENSEAEKKKE